MRDPKHLEVFQSVTSAIPAARLLGVLSDDGILVHSSFIHKVLPAANFLRRTSPRTPAATQRIDVPPPADARKKCLNMQILLSKLQTLFGYGTGAPVP
jgi:hypothetical protein